MKTIRDLKPKDIKDKTILVRVDYNVPLKDGKVTDDLRIRASLPTLQFLLKAGARRLVLISHLGRPKGKANPEFTLSLVADVLRKLLPDESVEFFPLPHPNDKKLKDITKSRVVLLENLRFDPREEAGDGSLIEEIVNFAEPTLFVQDGFAVLHRPHASVSAVKDYLPAYAGFLVENEIKNLSAVLDQPESPVLLIIGGAKVDDKAPLIEKFSSLADHIFVGGKIAADGYQAKNSKILVAHDFDEDASGAKLDIGPLSAGNLANLIVDAKTIIWNGLLGYAEDPAFATASTIAAELIGERRSAKTIICGGDTTGFVENLAKVHPNLNYSLISTGGGAALEFLSGKTLPGITALE